MFKLIHTSDWHLGHTFHQFNRDEEFNYFLSQLYDIVRHEQPDAICISGDIFDTMSPSISTQRLWASALEKLSTIVPDMNIVAIAGNHDSGSKLEIYAHIFRDNIRIVGKKPEIITLRSRDGSDAVICAVPYIPGAFYRNYLEATGELDDTDSAKTFFSRMAVRAHQKKSSPSSPVILMAHTAVSGSDFTGQDEYKFLFNDIDILGDKFDYVALGHIHFPQTLKQDKTTIRYCGAPLAMGFDENYSHSISVVTFPGNETAPLLSIIEMQELRKPITLYKTNPLKVNDVDAFLRSYNPTEPQYIRLYYLDDGHFTLEHIRRIQTHFANSDMARLCLIVPSRPDITDDVMSEIQKQKITLDNITSFDPLNIARLCFAKKRNIEIPDNLIDLLKSVIDENIED